ncbi:MAG: hypothetical protein JRF33_18930 [Deltaproteobacteria bacterium]|nr:hypothetical protein [Deltaproteobacteria bacterium]
MKCRLPIIALAIALMALTACEQSKTNTPPKIKPTNYFGAYARVFNTLGETGQIIRAELDKTQPAALKSTLEPKLKLTEETLIKAKDATPVDKPKLPKLADMLLDSTQELLTAYSKASGDKSLNPDTRKTALERQLQGHRQALLYMGRALDKLEDESMAAEIAARAGDKNYSYWFRHYNAEAKVMLRATQKARGEASAAVAQLQKALQGIEAYAKEQGESINPDFKTYCLHAKAFADAAGRWQGTPGADSLKAVEQAFNKLIVQGNKLFGREARGTLK